MMCRKGENRFMSNNAIRPIVLFGIILVISIIALVYWKNYTGVPVMSLQESMNLDYNADISSIKIITVGSKPFVNNEATVIIEDNENIHEIISYVNSLQLAPDEIPEDYTYYDVNFYLYVYKNNSSEIDAFVFTKNYVSFSSDSSEQKRGLDYYIMDSGYNPITQSSNVYKFLYDVITDTCDR